MDTWFTDQLSAQGRKPQNYNINVTIVGLKQPGYF